MSIFTEIDEIPLEVTGRAAHMLNVYLRAGSGFLDSEGVKDVLRIIAINTHRHERERAYRHKPDLTDSDEIG